MHWVDRGKIGLMESNWKRFGLISKYFGESALSFIHKLLQWFWWSRGIIRYSLTRWLKFLTISVIRHQSGRRSINSTSGENAKYICINMFYTRISEYGVQDLRDMNLNWCAKKAKKKKKLKRKTGAWNVNDGLSYWQTRKYNCPSV